MLRSGLLKSQSFSNASDFRNVMIEQRWNSYLDKPLHGHYFTTCSQFGDLPLIFHWLTHGDLTLENKGFLTACSSRSSCNSSSSPVCRLCGQHNETVQHLLCGCSVHAGVLIRSAMTKLLLTYTGTYVVSMNCQDLSFGRITLLQLLLTLMMSKSFGISIFLQTR